MSRSAPTIDNAYQHETATCDNCGTVWPIEKLNDITSFFQRVAAGEPVPAGECPDPECTALCHVPEREPPKPTFKERYRKVCGDCGGTNVVADAYAAWNETLQAWEVDNVFDKGAYCDDCDSSEIRIHEETVTEGE